MVPILSAAVLILYIITPLFFLCINIAPFITGLITKDDTLEKYHLSVKIAIGLTPTTCFLS